MAILVASRSALSTAANTKSGDLVAGQYQHVGRGKFTVVALASVTGLNMEVRVGGISLIADEVIPYTGTAGTLDASAHLIANQVLNGGRVELFVRNTTGGAITVDFQLWFEPL